MSDKSSRWAFTAYEEQFSCFEGDPPPGVAEWGWNTEICPKTNRTHYQGYLRLAQQQRFAWVRKIFPGVHVEIARDWNALLMYCKKDDTRAPGTEPHKATNTVVNHFVYAQEVAEWLWQQCKDDELLGGNNSLNTWSYSTFEKLMNFKIDTDIVSGKLHAAWITTNPAWMAMWKQKWRPFIKGAGLRMEARQTDRQTPENILLPGYSTNGQEPQQSES